MRAGSDEDVGGGMALALDLDGVRIDQAPAAFDQAGTYVLRLTASDTLLTASSDVTITVNPPPPTNKAPEPPRRNGDTASA